LNTTALDYRSDISLRNFLITENFEWYSSAGLPKKWLVQFCEFHDWLCI